MSNRDSGDVILSFLLGGLIGAAIGILYAPRSGKEVRRKLRDLSEDLSEKLEDLSETVKVKAEGIVGDVKEKAEHIIEESKEKVLTQKECLEAALEAGLDAGRRTYEKKNK